MAKILIEEKIINDALVSVEQANIYHAALVKIMRMNPQTDEGKEIRQIAIESIGHALDIGSLSAEIIGE